MAGLIGRFLSLVGLNLSADVSDDENLTSVHMLPPGVDAHPLPDDSVLLVPIAESGGHATAGYVDAINDPQAQPGELRLYSRAESGEVMGWVWLRNDGGVLLSNNNYTITAAANGDLTLTTPAASVEVMAGGRITARNQAASIEMQDGGAITAAGPKASATLTQDGAVTVAASQAVTIGNGAGSIAIGTDGVVTINGVTFATNAFVKATRFTAQSMRVGGKELNNHRHTGVTTGSGLTGNNV